MRHWAATATSGGMAAAQVDGHVAAALVSRAAAEAALPAHQADALADCQEALAMDPQHIDGLALRSTLTMHSGLHDGEADASVAANLLLPTGDAQRTRMAFTDALASYAQAASIHADERSARDLQGTLAQRD